MAGTNAILCPHCGAIESPQNPVCHRCGRSLRAPERPKAEVARFLARPDLPVVGLRSVIFVHYVVVGLVAILAGARPLELLLPGELFAAALLKLGALSGAAVLQNGEWWRLFTAMFAHFGVLHLLFNTMALNAVGPETARNLGTARFLFVYLASGVLGNATSLWWHDGRLFQVGASGAICGLIGSLTMVARLRGGAYAQIVQRTTTQWIFMTLLFGFLISGVDNAAHIAGMVSGALLTRLVGLKRTWTA